MMNKVYMVVARTEKKEEHLSFLAWLMGGNTQKTKYYGDFNLAIFSTREEADKFMNNANNLPFNFKSKDCHIQEWRVDYELNWEEWEKEEKLVKKTK